MVADPGLPREAEPLQIATRRMSVGTGAEVTRYAVIGVPEHSRKVSRRGDLLPPGLAAVDPELNEGAGRSPGEGEMTDGKWIRSHDSF